MPHGPLTPFSFPFPRPVPDRTLRVACPLLRTLGDDADDVFALARDLGICSPTWLQTGCVYGPQPGNAFSILVMPVLPDATKRHNIYHVASPAVAPSLALYAAYRTGALSWHDFALRYLAELDAKRSGTFAQFVEDLCSVPARYSGVLLLGFRQAPGGNEARVRCSRRLLHAWLLNEVERLPELQRPLPLLAPTPVSRRHSSPRPRLYAC